jgi:hypothetical protein
MNGELERAYRRIKKKAGWDNPERIIAELRETMVKMSPVPAQMAIEAAQYFIDDIQDDSFIYRAQEVMELFNGDPQLQKKSMLSASDWNFIRELVDEWAAEMDMDIVTGIMTAAVDNGVF